MDKNKQQIVNDFVKWLGVTKGNSNFTYEVKANGHIRINKDGDKFADVWATTGKFGLYENGTLGTIHKGLEKIKALLIESDHRYEIVMDELQKEWETNQELFSQSVKSHGIRSTQIAALVKMLVDKDIL